jgi:hypothetical protein
MNVSKSLRRPSNWQDFESLCKKLWGEIWDCPEIKKNGRSGQVQNGVDIYGIPKGETQYYGIQCKGKDEYTHKQFSEEEITNEIEKANSFQPALKKLYFATTALKDAKIESFVRKKNIENLKNDLFEVHLFSWEDIVDLIDENRITHDWYLNSQKFKLTKEAKITFSNDLNEVTCNAIFVRPRNKSVYRMGARDADWSKSLFDSIHSEKYIRQPIPETYINLSFFPVMIKLHNTGTQSIEDFKIILNFEGDIQEIADTNESGGLNFSSVHSNIFVDQQGNKVKVAPPKSILVSDDTFCSDEIFIKPNHNAKQIVVKWKLLSRDFKNEGELTISVIINIETEEREVNVPNSFKAQYTWGNLEDYIIPLSDLRG